MKSTKKNKKKISTSVKKYYNIVIGGFIGAYIALFLNELMDNSDWNTLDGKFLAVIAVIVLGFLAFHTNRES